MSEQATTTVQLKPKDYKGELPPVWCPGCGDFGVLAATQRALAERQIPQKDLVFVSGIGCSSRFPHFMKSYGFHSVHGRALPVAMGMALADPERHIIAVGGDGDGMAIGAGHFLHTARRNPHMTYVMMDNEIYGLTKGQASPTSEQGLKTKTTPFAAADRSADRPLNPLALAILSGATFVARAYSGNIKQMVELIGQAFDHDGYAFVQCISPCVTFHDIYEKARNAQNSLDATHDTSNQAAAIAAAIKDPFTTGLFYKEDRQTLQEAVAAQKAEAAANADSGLNAIANKILATA